MSMETLSGEQVFETVVDGLLARGFAVIDQFFSEEETRRLLDYARERFSGGQFKKAGIGKDSQLDERIRGDFIQWIDRPAMDASHLFLFDRLEALVRYLNRTCYLGIRDLELHCAVYPPGAGYHRHLDVFRNTRSRRLSVIFYLNFDWQAEMGGALRLFLPQPDASEQTLDILPLAGRMVCFQSDRLEHAVLPASQNRYSITGWLKDSPPIYGDSPFRLAD